LPRSSGRLMTLSHRVTDGNKKEAGVEKFTPRAVKPLTRRSRSAIIGKVLERLGSFGGELPSACAFPYLRPEVRAI